VDTPFNTVSPLLQAQDIKPGASDQHYLFFCTPTMVQNSCLLRIFDADQNKVLK